MKMTEAAEKLYREICSEIASGTALAGLAEQFKQLRELHSEWSARSANHAIEFILPQVGGIPRSKRKGQHKVLKIANKETWKRLLMDPKYFVLAHTGSRLGTPVYWPISEFISCCASRALKVYDWGSRPNVSERIVDSSDWKIG